MPKKRQETEPPGGPFANARLLPPPHQPDFPE